MANLTMHIFIFVARNKIRKPYKINKSRKHIKINSMLISDQIYI